jgi:glyoxylase-like metal-dependent hydrolase (beta-lactamase superfamily II)
MKRPASGRVHERITAIATTSYPAYIVRGETKSLMIDSGVNLMRPFYLAEIRRMFGDGGRPDYLFFTHSHYDHVGSGDYLKRHLPGLRLGAHERTAALVRKPSALETMNHLSASHLELREYNLAGEDVTLHPFEIDIVLKQGDEIDLGGLTCRVYEVPGHTRDSLAFYFPEIEALFPGDACGVLRTGTDDLLQVEFVASYQDYVDSLRLMISLAPKIVCPAHNWVLTDDDAARFLERSLAETFRYRELIERYLDAASGDVDRAIDDMARAEFDGDDPSLPPSAAYITNLTAQVRHIAEIRAEGDAR